MTNGSAADLPQQDALCGRGRTPAQMQREAFGRGAARVAASMLEGSGSRSGCGPWTCWREEGV